MPKYNVVLSISYTIEAKNAWDAETLCLEDLETVLLDAGIKNFESLVTEADRSLPEDY